MLPSPFLLYWIEVSKILMRFNSYVTFMIRFCTLVTQRLTLA